MRMKLLKGGKCVRFSPHIINTAMSLYLRSRKCYEELNQSGLLCLPYPRHLRRISGSLKIAEGGDHMIYSMFQEEVQERKSDNCTSLVGHLMLDEIKLKNGIAFNVNSNEVIGFLPDHLNTTNVYQDIINECDKSIDKPSSKMSVYANQ